MNHSMTIPFFRAAASLAPAFFRFHADRGRKAAPRLAGMALGKTAAAAR
ncbi:hypothetical protein [Shinella pollutisoli]|uniref:Uncharacterized protein n=1 Tax=Shinella pollutisoli TaxID=2250594 RepID=A0ABV7DLL7_9HYPH|nr:hypothetical protein [Shinella pollutisoli]